VKDVAADFEQLYREGRYQEAITAASALSQPTTRSLTVIGVSYLRLGDAATAEYSLRRAMGQGDEEARVEYGNLLRFSGRLQDAARYLTQLLPEMDGVWHTKCLRWLGVTQHQLGNVKEAISNLENAKREFERVNDNLSSALIKQNLFVIYSELNDAKKANRLIDEAILVFRNSDRPNLLITGLRNKIVALLMSNRYEEVSSILVEIETLLSDGITPGHIHYWVSKAALFEQGIINRSEYIFLLDNIIENAEVFQIFDSLIWALVKKIEYLIQSDRNSEAMRLVYQAPQDEFGQFPTSIRIVRAMINRRMGNLVEAVEELGAVAADLEAAGNIAELARVRLQLAYALHLDGQPDASADVLRAALQGLLRTNIHPSMRPELEELAELLHFAALEPSLAPYLEPVMDSLAGVLGGVSGDEGGERVRLQVHTLGRVSILRGGDPVTFQLKGTVPLLVYLALTPNRTRLEIQQDLYPDKDPDAASSYVRKGIQELRELLGHGAVLTEGPRNHSRYRLGPGLQLDLDLTRFLDAIGRAETARALALYRGEFLPGSDESEWVLQKRDEARLALTFELQNQMVAFQENHEWRRVILLANQYLRVDPYEVSVHALRVEAARRVGTAAELGRYVAAMNSASN